MTEKARNILVVLPRPLGDAVMALAALKKLRQAFPQARISVFGFASTCEVLEHHPDVDARIPAKMNNTGKFKLWSGIKQLRKTSFDVAVLLNNSFRSALLVRLSGIKHAVGYRREGRGILLHHAITPFRLVGEYAPLAMAHYYQRLIHHAIIQWGGQNAYNDAHETGKLYIGPDDETGADRLLEKWNISKTDKRVMLVPGGAFGPSKYWPVFRWAQLADKLVEAEKCRVVLCCTPNIDEQNIAQAIQTHAHNRIYNLGEHSVSLGVLKALIQGCTLIVAHDTGPVHIAAALGTPVVTLFGPTDPRWTAANYKREIRLHHPEACPPCQNPYCLRDHACMNAITVDEVWQAVQRLLHGDMTSTDSSVFTPGRPYRVFAESFAPSTDDHGLIHEGYLDALRAAGLDTLDKVFTFKAGQRLEKPGLGTRERIRFELDVQNRQVGVYLKRFGRPTWRQWLQRLITYRDNSATAMFDFWAAMRLAQVGIAAPRPVAVGVKRGNLREKHSFVMLEELPCADALERLLPYRGEAAQKYTLLRDHKQLIIQTAALVRRLHEAGYVHRDLYLSHLFISRDETGKERLVLIDLQRVFRPWLRKRRWIVKDLAQLCYSSQRLASRTQMVRFARHYFDGGKLTPAQKALLRAVIRKSRHIARRQQRKCAK